MEEKENKYPLKQVATAVGITIVAIVALATLFHSLSINSLKSVIDSKDAIIESKNQSYESLEDKFVAKNDTISDLRKRLYMIEKNKTAYTILSNKELKQKTLSIVKSIRNDLNEYWKLSHESSDENYKEYQKMSDELSYTLESNYNINKVDIILCKDELISRIPNKYTKKRESFIELSYENPVNPLGYEMVLDDLERLAKLLID